MGDISTIQLTDQGEYVVQTKNTFYDVTIGNDGHVEVDFTKNGKQKHREGKLLMPITLGCTMMIDGADWRLTTPVTAIQQK